MATQQTRKYVKLAPRRTSWDFRFLQIFALAVLMILLVKSVLGPFSTALHAMNMPAPSDLRDRIVAMAPELPQLGMPMSRVHEMYEGGARFNTIDTISVIAIEDGKPILYSLTGVFITTGDRIEIDSSTVLFEIRQVNEFGTFYYWTSWSQLEQLE